MTVVRDDRRQSGICCEDAGRGAFVILSQVQDTLHHQRGAGARVCDIRHAAFFVLSICELPMPAADCSTPPIRNHFADDTSSNALVLAGRTAF